MEEEKRLLGATPNHDSRYMAIDGQQKDLKTSERPNEQTTPITTPIGPPSMSYLLRCIHAFTCIPATITIFLKVTDQFTRYNPSKLELILGFVGWCSVVVHFWITYICYGQFVRLTTWQDAVRTRWATAAWWFVAFPTILACLTLYKYAGEPTCG